jgi:hypothetical protein
VIFILQRGSVGYQEAKKSIREDNADETDALFRLDTHDLHISGLQISGLQVFDLRVSGSRVS